MKTILNKQQIEHKILRLSFEIIEGNLDTKSILLIGLEKNGFVIAKKIKNCIEQKASLNIDVVKMTLKKNKENKIFSDKITDEYKTFILIDDVLKSGKTIIHAIKELLKFNIEKLETVVLINRKHNVFPVGVNYVGLELSTTLENHIEVILDDEKKIGAYLG
ncbi:MAG: hypothetical protein CMP68_03335 [Flavobacteriales bacterium]|nr:hypothetical protein [Flavobacteriales bacterium]|tara:strand:+ start:4838 stop:5323 length:486 start_codon:yes stop_codon:yes gene_type:complete